MPARSTRRSFLGSTATTVAAASALTQRGAPSQVIPGFDQTRTEVDRTQTWQPFSDRKIRVGLVGYGVCKFSAEFEFQNHPNVEVVAVSDLFPDRREALAKRVRCSKTYPSLEEMVKDDRIEAIFVATDAPSHARHCIEVLNHGKHVCTAVPAFRGDIEDAERLLECVKKNRGLVYAMFETSVFHDDLYAMEKLHAANVFGEIVYCEGEYCHPHTLGAPSLGSYKDWRRNGAPMWYPTHATAYYVGVTHDSLVEVSCLGTAPFDKSRRRPNGIGNIFNSEVGLFRTRRGGLCRFIICGSQGEYLEAGRLRGEYAGYDWHNGRAEGFVGDAAGKRRFEEARSKGLRTRKYALPPGVSPDGHGGSHGYLGDDFVDAILRGRKPAVDVIDALNMTVPGYYAHLSATKDGETIKIPQYSL
jgi:predicted dehydrogenase